MIISVFNARSRLRVPYCSDGFSLFVRIHPTSKSELKVQLSLLIWNAQVFTSRKTLRRNCSTRLVPP